MLPLPPCVHQQPSSWLPSAVPAPPRHHFGQHGRAPARGLRELFGTGTAAPFLLDSLGSSCSRGEEWMPSQTEWRARVESPGSVAADPWGWLRIIWWPGHWYESLPCQGCLPCGQVCARHHRDWQHSLLPALLLACSTWLWTELKKILLRLPLQLWHHYLLHPTQSSLSQLSPLVSDFWIPFLSVLAASQAEKVQKP